MFTSGEDDGVDGKVVIDRRDIIVTPFKKYVSDPTELTIEQGLVQNVRGGFDDEKAYGISHIGWGCNENARWSGLQNDRRSIGMESRAFYGNVLFSTGPNSELGGSNDTHATSTFRCATAACSLTMSPSCSAVSSCWTTSGHGAPSSPRHRWQARREAAAAVRGKAQRAEGGAVTQTAS